jgi:hypothetical protein
MLIHPAGVGHDRLREIADDAVERLAVKSRLWAATERWSSIGAFTLTLPAPKHVRRGYLSGSRRPQPAAGRRRRRPRRRVVRRTRPQRAGRSGHDGPGEPDPSGDALLAAGRDQSQGKSL